MYYYRRLRDLREDNDLLQKDVARYLNITREQYQLYESGKREIKLNLIIKLAQLYKVSIDYITELTDNPKPNWHIKNQTNVYGGSIKNITMN